MIETIYILSAGRSGSTLLDLMLGSHPLATAVGEITHLPKNLALNTTCSCGHKVTSCAFWQRVVARVSIDIGEDVTQNPYALELGFIAGPNVIDRQSQTLAYRLHWKIRHGAMVASLRAGLPLPTALRRRFDLSVCHTKRVYEAVRDVSGRPLIVDSSKTYVKGLAIYQAAPEKTRLVLLTRDGRASYYSRIRDGFTRRDALKAWLKYYERALPLIDKHVPASHLIRVKYESLAENPFEVCNRVCNELQVEFSENMMSFGRMEHHVADGNDMRLNKDSRVQLDTRWQQEMSATDLAYFERRAGHMNRFLGYC